MEENRAKKSSDERAVETRQLIADLTTDLTLRVILRQMFCVHSLRM